MFSFYIFEEELGEEEQNYVALSVIFPNAPLLAVRHVTL